MAEVQVAGAAAAPTSKTWSADTILEKYLGITDEASRIRARKALLEATNEFVTTVQLAPDANTIARITIGDRSRPSKTFTVDLRPGGGLERDPSEVSKAYGNTNNTLNAFSFKNQGEALANRFHVAFIEIARQAGKTVTIAQSRRLEFVLDAIARKTTRNFTLKAIRDFRQHLDPAALRIMDRAGDHDLRLYNYLQANDQKGDPETARRRKQACESYPLLTNAFMKSKELTHVIDTAGVLRPAIAKFIAAGTELPVPPLHVVDRLQGLNWQKTGREAVHEPAHFLFAVMNCPADWVPQSRAQWHAMLSVSNQVFNAFHSDTFFGVAGDANQGPKDFWPNHNAASMMKLLGPDWQKAAKKLTQAGGFDGVRDMVKSIQKHCLASRADDLAADIAKKVGVPPQFNEDGLDKNQDDLAYRINKRFFTAIGGSFTPIQALDASAEWHDRIAAVNAAIHKCRHGDTPDPLVWGKATEDFHAPNGLKVVMLASEAELMVEGARMNHCVGGYAESALASSLILSVRDKTGASVATAEIDQAGRSLQSLAPRQIQGEGNTDPDRTAKTAINAWLKAVKTGTLAFDETGLEAGRARAREGYAEALRNHEETPEQAAEIWRIHQRFMPKSMRSQPSAEAWISSPAFEPNIKDALTYAEGIKFRTEKLPSTPRIETAPNLPIIDESAWTRVGNILSGLAGRVFRPAAEPPRLTPAEPQR